MELIDSRSVVLDLYETDAFTIPERVTRFLLDHRPNAYCDDCMADLLRLRRTQVSMITSTLGLCQEYTRGGKSCVMCQRERKFATHVNDLPS